MSDTGEVDDTDHLDAHTGLWRAAGAYGAQADFEDLWDVQ